MEYITLRNGIKMPILGFGTYPLKGDMLTKTVEYSYGVGCSLYDTANLYQNERDLGRTIKELSLDRNTLFLTSKIDSSIFNGRKRYFYLDKKNVFKVYRESCKKADIDYWDLYLLHSPFDNYLKAYEQLLSLYEKGKVKSIGVCNFDISKLEIINQEFGEYPMVNQIELHPFNQQQTMQSFCKEHNIQIECYSPFTSGKAIEELLENVILVEIAKKYRKNVFQIILRWITLLNVVVVPRSSTKQHIEDNFNIFDFKLTEDEMELIKTINRKESFCNYAHVVV